MEGDGVSGGPWEGNDYRHLRVARQGVAAVITLARPEVHNAFNAELIEELHTVFTRVSESDDVRTVILRGEGKNFCAGADLNWMRASLEYSHDENVADALRMADMFQAMDACRHPVIGRIQGYALGGGAGLTAVCDIAIAAEDARFGFTEARLGISPAVISPFVLRKIGQSHARALFVTAERFDAARALAIGLVHQVVPAAALDAAIERTVREIAQNGPAGVRAAKLMARTVPQLDASEARETTAATIAGLRVGPEGQAGIRAFLEKRPAPWVNQDA
ncbi:MAG TPA: enoyl-CoA hydratase-related protein [Ktedonobacterales bacterium]